MNMHMLRLPAPDPRVSHIHMSAIARLLEEWDADAENDNYSKGEAANDLRDALAAACTCRALPHDYPCPKNPLRADTPEREVCNCGHGANLHVHEQGACRPANEYCPCPWFYSGQSPASSAPADTPEDPEGGA